MELKDLYGAILILTLVAVLTAIVLILLGNFQSVSGVTYTASQSIGGFITGIGSIGISWAGIIVLITVASIIIGLVVRSFGFGAGTRVERR